MVYCMAFAREIGFLLLFLWCFFFSVSVSSSLFAVFIYYNIPGVDSPNLYFSTSHCIIVS